MSKSNTIATEKFNAPRIFLPIFYLLRISLLFFLLFYLFSSGGYFDILSPDLTEATKIAAALDVLQALFYAILFPALFLLFIPLGFIKSLSLRTKVIFYLTAVMFCGVLPIYLLSSCRPGVTPDPLIISFFILCTLNVLGVIVLSDRWVIKYPKVGRALIRIPILFDLLLPMAVWLEHGKNLPHFFRLLRVLPVLYLLAPPALITLNSLPPRNVFPKIEKTFRQIHTFPLDSFHAVPGPDEKELWISKLQSMTKVDILNEKPEISVDIPTYPIEGRGANVFAFDNQKKTILAAGHVNGNVRLIKVDADTLKIFWDRSYLVPKGEKMQRSIIMSDQKRQMVFAAYDSGFIENKGGGILRFSEDLESVTHFNSCGNLFDAVADFDNSQIFALYAHPGLIVRYDVDSLNVISAAAIPEMGETLLHDRKAKKLYIAFPAQGLIRVYDSESLNLLHTLNSVLGVKSMILLEAERKIIAGGYSPYVDVFDLNEMKLVNRFKAPAWQRGIDLSPEKERIYFSTFVGIWWIPSRQALSVQGSDRVARYDPFFTILRLSVQMILRHFDFQVIHEPFDLESCRRGTKFDPPIAGLDMIGK